MDGKNETVLVSNAFTRLLCEFRGGKSASELSEALQECVAACQETGKKAELTYKLKISKTTSGAVTVMDDLSAKVPRLDREKAIFFVTEDNTLQRDNPLQKTLDLRTVAGSAEVRDVTAPVALAPAVNQ